MKELIKLAVAKGFKATVASTLMSVGKYLTEADIYQALSNDICDYLLLCEIQKWMEDIHNIYIVISPKQNKYLLVGFYAEVLNQYATSLLVDEEIVSDSKEECFLNGITLALKSIENDKETK